MQSYQRRVIVIVFTPCAMACSVITILNVALNIAIGETAKLQQATQTEKKFCCGSTQGVPVYNSRPVWPRFSPLRDIAVALKCLPPVHQSRLSCYNLSQKAMRWREFFRAAQQESPRIGRSISGTRI